MAEEKSWFFFEKEKISHIQIWKVYKLKLDNLETQNKLRIVSIP